MVFYGVGAVAMAFRKSDLTMTEYEIHQQGYNSKRLELWLKACPPLDD